MPENRLFVWPTFEIGHVATLSHIKTEDNSNITVTTLHNSPRIFRVEHFFSENEARKLIERAVSIEDNDHKLKRSSTGISGYNIDPTRTSENAFDTASEV